MNPRSEAKKVISAYWQDGTVPVDPAALAIKMGVSVLADAHMEESGHYEPNGLNGRPLIAYNPNESSTRQRFTIAHELGHHILGHGARNRDTPEHFTMTNRDQAEVGANKFAASLLMPDDYLKAVIDVRNIRNVDRLAGIFNVSRTAMIYRLKELGYGF